MSEEAKKYHEEEAIKKSYDYQTTRRLFSYLRKYWKMMVFALCLTFLTNILISLQPYFTKIAVDDFITPKRTEGVWTFAIAFFGLFLFRFVFSYIQEPILRKITILIKCNFFSVNG